MDNDGDLITLPSTVDVSLSKQACYLLHSLTLQDQSVDFLISVQHDCIMVGCPTDARKAEMQEREITSRKAAAVKHLDDDHLSSTPIPCTILTDSGNSCPQPYLL